MSTTNPAARARARGAAGARATAGGGAAEAAAALGVAATVTATSGSGGDGVRSVQRALRIVEIVAGGPFEGMTLTAIAAALGLSKSSV
ncbi:MAG TPA: helix-turn-helix domain-containing protein, partial [Acidimicrobiales bacterium]|nr:helix-turn-helix domain-containing protein [Acidimicrobiales bacterium]